MPSIQRQPHTKNWIAVWYRASDGKQIRRSTGTSDRRKARAIAEKYESADRLARENRLTADRARQVIADLYAIANSGERLESETVSDYLAAWLKKKELEVVGSSFVEYGRLVKDLVGFLGAKSKRHIDTITAGDATAFRAHLAVKVSAGTVNKNLKVLRGAWAQAAKDGLIQRNVFASVGLVSNRDAKRRRAFTEDEIRRILAVCDPEWRGLVLTGLYTGQRLSDIVSLRWSQIELGKAEPEIRFRTKKTGSDLTIPIAPPLLQYFLSIPSSDNPNERVFPEQADALSVNQSTVSRRFAVILARAGILPMDKATKNHTAKGKGRHSRRQSSELSFHCLRHSATSWLKNAGVSDVVAREIIGHKSEAVSRRYTHIETATLRQALERLPDVTVGSAKMGEAQPNSRWVNS